MAGYYPDNSDCASFYRCVDWDEDKGERFSVYFFRCPNGTIYDPAINTCNHPENIQPPRDCSNQGGTTEPAPEGTTEQGQETTTAGSPGSEGTTSGSTGTEGTTAAQSSTEGTTTTASSESTDPPAEIMQTTTVSQAQETTTESNAAGTTTTAGSTAGPQETTPAEESTKSPPEESSTTSGPEESTTSGSQTTDGPAQSECENLQPGQYAFVCPTGFRRHPRYCNRFYQCTEKDDSEINVLTFNCPENTIFDNNQQQCLPVGMFH
jgi:Chitin binding Peritrophin-A domain